MGRERWMYQEQLLRHCKMKTDSHFCSVHNNPQQQALCSHSPSLFIVLVK